MKLLKSIRDYFQIAWFYLLDTMFPDAADIRNGRINTKCCCDEFGTVQPAIPTPSIPPQKPVAVRDTAQFVEVQKDNPVKPQAPKTQKPKTPKKKVSVDQQIAQAAKAAVKPAKAKPTKKKTK